MSLHFVIDLFWCAPSPYPSPSSLCSPLPSSSCFSLLSLNASQQTLNTITQKARGDASPMGGLQVIFTGDFLQLPPVAKLKAGTLSAYFVQESNATGSASRGGYGSSSSYNHVPSRSQSDPSCCRPTSNPISASSLSRLTDPTRSVVSKTANETCGSALASSITEFQNARFCFQSSVWGDIIGKNTFVLTNIFRQSDAAFASLLNSVRCGELTGDESLVLIMK
jgi:hypothetical protein